MRLEAKTAVITGAGSGMGRAMAHLFTKEGAKVVAADWHQQTLDEVVAEVKGAGGTIVGVKTDVSSQAETEAMIDKAVAEFGSIDILVNNAGVMDRFAGVGSADEEIWKRVLAVNLDGPRFAMRHAVNKMVAQGHGSILNIASVAGCGGAAAGAAYTTSKHALIGLTMNTAWMYAKRGVRCNAIAAGGVNTNIMQSIDQSKIDVEGLAALKPYHDSNPATLESIDIALLALFLVSDEARYINGTIIPADGGWRAA